ncbi:MAG: MerR family transcriptional regulator [Christensenellaceae bacterium]|jgi:DNA-binding transcriptional MerR regulator
MLTIGGFSKLGNVSRRMLRHYDSIGLLRPAYTAENGYRYYDYAQLAVLRQVETLKKYGFGLAEIGELLSLPEDRLAQRIHERRLHTHEQINELKKTLRAMEEDIVRMEGTGIMTQKYHIIVMDAPAQNVFCLRRTIDVSETHQLFHDLKEEMKKHGLKRTGATQLVYMGDTFSYSAMDVEAQIAVAGSGDGVKPVPAQPYAATTHIGPYETVHYAYEALQGWFKEHPEYEATGGGIERYIKDEEDVSSPDELETGILFPVRKTG